MGYRDKDIYQRAFKFSILAVKFVDDLPKNVAMIEIGKQLVRSATSISANIAEGSGGSSKKEFTNFMNIALKSAIETEHWLSLLKGLGYMVTEELSTANTEIIKILTVIVRNSK